MARERGATRARLLDAALDAFAREGFAGASIRAITRAVGVRESAFYAHFESKRAIYDELFAESGPAVVSRLVEVLGEDDPAVALPRLATTLIEAWVAPRARSFATIALRDAFAGDARGYHALLAGIDDALHALGARIAAWQAAGLITSGAQPEVLAYEFIAPISMARFLFFNVAAGDAEAQRGRRLVEEHAASYVALGTRR